jgi:transposase
MLPTISHTYAPRGKTPTISVSGQHTKRWYIASAISPLGDCAFFLRNKPFDTKAIIEYLTYLMAQFQQKLLIIWDGASIHKSEELKQWLAQQEQGQLHLVQQPHYSPELNADEQVWYHLKRVKLKDKCNQNFNELNSNIIEKLNDIKNDKQLIMNFFKHPDLGFYN